MFKKKYEVDDFISDARCNISRDIDVSKKLNDNSVKVLLKPCEIEKYDISLDHAESIYKNEFENNNLVIDERIVTREGTILFVLLNREGEL